MKIRSGFVSNSSSSSFICSVCGIVEAGYDMLIEEAGMAECVNGHTFCTSHAVEPLDELSSIYDVPPDYCPICQLTELPESAVMKYYFKKHNISLKDAVRELMLDNKTIDDIPKDFKLLINDSVTTK